MKEGIWLINKDGDVEYIKELVKEKKTSIEYVNQNDEIVAVDKNYFKTYEELLLHATSYLIGSKVQYFEDDEWKGCCELIKFIDFIRQVKNPFIILEDDSCKAVDKIRLYDERILAIEREMDA